MVNIMKNKKLVIILSLMIFAVVASLLFFFGYKTYAIEDNGETLIYNNSVYTQIPYDFEFGQSRELLPDDRIDIAKVLINKEKTYVFPKTYYVYKGDTFDSPNVIYEENKSFGVSGWLYIKNGFNYASADIESSEIIEVFAEYIDKWSTEDKAVIERVKTAILNGEDLVPIISEYTDIEWSRLYIRFENTPFVQQVGWQENGKFQYNLRTIRNH